MLPVSTHLYSLKLNYSNLSVCSYDYLATKTHSIIIPSSGMDSIPSDLSVYLSNKTLKTLVGPDTMIDESTSAFDVLWGASGGSIATLISMLEDVPRFKRTMARTDFVLSNCMYPFLI